jgi:predicted Fe-Mo cluster-binding NifX family protein
MTEGPSGRAARLAFTSSGARADDPVDPRFGRCPYFLLYDEQGDRWEALPNSAMSLGNGAGIQAAQELASRKVTVVVTGDIGPNAHRVLSAAGIRVFVGCQGTVENALAEYRAGKLAEATGPTRQGHHGAGPRGWGGNRW